MKKVFLTICILLSFFAIEAKSQEEGKFFEDVMISDDIKKNQKSTSAKDRASQLLDSKPVEIKIEGAPLQFRSQRVPTIKTLAQPVDTTTKYGEAPFGLSWGATYNQTKALGTDLTRTELKDLPNSFIVTKLPKPLADFREVTITFGDDNMLWRIIAQGKEIEDDAKATKALKLYRQYFKLLNQKYGRAQEFFSPKVTVLETPYKDDYGRDKIRIDRIESTIGGPTFVEELQSGESSLYATFEGNGVGAALTLGVNEQGESFIIIDYTNLRIYKEREDRTLNAL